MGHIKCTPNLLQVSIESIGNRDGHAERFTRDRDGNTVDGCIVDVQSVTPPQDLTGDAKPETAVLLSCSPQPSNYFNQEVQVFNKDSKLLATLKDLDPCPMASDLRQCSIQASLVFAMASL